MKKAAKILCIIALIFGLIWATVGFFGSWVGGAVVATVEEMGQDAQSADVVMEKSASLMLRLLGSFVVVIIGGVLGIVGAGKKNSLNPIILGILTFICGCLLFPLNNYVAAVIYLVAGLLLLLAGLTTKQAENISDDMLGKKKLMLSMIGIGIALVVSIVAFFILRDSPEKQTEIVNEVIIDEQQTESEPTISSEEQFESFIQTFTSDKNFQLSRIKFPLRLVKSKDEWIFLGTNDIFEEVKITKEIAYRGTFDKESDNKYRYMLYSVYLFENDGEYDYDGGELSFGLDFSKIDGKWMVTDIFYGGEE